MYDEKNRTVFAFLRMVTGLSGGGMKELSELMVMFFILRRD